MSTFHFKFWTMISYELKNTRNQDEKGVFSAKFGNGHNLKYDVVEIAIALIPELPSYMICRLYLHINYFPYMCYFTNMWTWLYENSTKGINQNRSFTDLNFEIFTLKLWSLIQFPDVNKLLQDQEQKFVNF